MGAIIGVSFNCQAVVSFFATNREEFGLEDKVFYGLMTSWWASVASAKFEREVAVVEYRKMGNVN